MKTRSFIAVNLPAKIRDYLAEMISSLRQTNSNLNIKWVKPEGLHFTLHFLGYLDEHKLIKVEEIISTSLKNISSTELELSDFDGFPNLNRSRVLFIGGREIGDRNILKNIQKKLGQQLEKIDIKIDKRPWRIHITLARLRVPQKIKIPKLQTPTLHFKVKSIDLMKSELSRQGAKYTIIKTFPLKPSL